MVDQNLIHFMHFTWDSLRKVVWKYQNQVKWVSFNPLISEVDLGKISAKSLVSNLLLKCDQQKWLCQKCEQNMDSILPNILCIQIPTDVNLKIVSHNGPLRLSICHQIFIDVNGQMLKNNLAIWSLAICIHYDNKRCFRVSPGH